MNSPVVAVLTVGLLLGTAAEAFWDEQGTPGQRGGLAFSGPPSPRLCNLQCQRRIRDDRCQCPPNPCENKICGRFTRCVVFGNRPTCIPLPSACLVTPSRGLCRGNLKRFYFNPDTRQCERFVYGGCSPNGNNFPFYSTCARTCMGSHLL